MFAITKTIEDSGSIGTGFPGRIAPTPLALGKARPPPSPSVYALAIQLSHLLPSARPPGQYSNSLEVYAPAALYIPVPLPLPLVSRLLSRRIWRGAPHPRAEDIMASPKNDVADPQARELTDRERANAQKAPRAQQASVVASIGCTRPTFTTRQLRLPKHEPSWKLSSDTTKGYRLAWLPWIGDTNNYLTAFNRPHERCTSSSTDSDVASASHSTPFDRQPSALADSMVYASRAGQQPLASFDSVTLAAPAAPKPSVLSGSASDALPAVRKHLASSASVDHVASAV